MPARSPLALVFTVGALVVGAAMALAVVFAGAGTGPSTATEARATVRAPIETVPAAPLELVALGHEQEAEGMTVRGVLRNPASGSEIRRLSAVVQLWTHDGVFVASARAPVQAATLQPGGETTFVVSVPAAAGADRYRVSFSIDDHVVPHVDVRS